MQNRLFKMLYVASFVFLCAFSCAADTQGLEQEIESLTFQIKESEFSCTTECVGLYNERGRLLFIGGQFEEAIADFTYILDTHSINQLGKSDVGSALWGRSLSYAFIGKEAELIEDLNAIGELAGLFEPCGCGDTLKRFELANNLNINDYHVVSFLKDNNNGYSFFLCDEFCENTVRNTAIFLKGMCNAVTDIGIKTVLYFFIDGLGDKAMRCCKTGGFWRECVEPMRATAEKWKLFGIPSDPAWD